MRILVSNDDGIHAPGLQALYRELCKLGQTRVVAPLQEKSTTGHSLTLHKPLRLLPIRKDFYGVSGSPADCVYLGIRQVMKELPDLVVSGINRGANLGQDVYYSGTVSAAREAAILGIPALAVSLAIDFDRPGAEVDSEKRYAAAAKVALKVAREMKRLQLPRHTLLNLNVPDVAASRLKGIRLGRQGFRIYSGKVLQRRDHRGKDYYWIGGRYQGFKPEEGTDCDLVARGYSSLTPLRLDSTDLQSLAGLDQSGHFEW